MLDLRLISRYSSYVEDLSIKKQDKALIYAKRARNIRTVLIDPKDTAVESAQFRYESHRFNQLPTLLNKTGFGLKRCSSSKLWDRM